MPKDKEKMTKEEKIEKAKELINDLSALELSDDEMRDVAGGIASSIIGVNWKACVPGQRKSKLW